MNSFWEVTLKNITYFITSFVVLRLLETIHFTDVIYRFWKEDMNHFVGVGIFWIDLNRTDFGCWRLTLTLAF